MLKNLEYGKERNVRSRVIWPLYIFQFRYDLNDVRCRNFPCMWHL